MKTFTTTTKTAAILTGLLFALTGGVLAQAARSGSSVHSGLPELELRVVELGRLPGFWSTACPIAERDATVWAAASTAEAEALRRQGFVLGVREPLRSRSGATGTSLAIRFRSAAAATADLDRRERLAGEAGYATNFAARGSVTVRAYTVRTVGLTIVRVAYVRGADEYAVEVQAGGHADVTRLQRILAAAVERAAGGK